MPNQEGIIYKIDYQESPGVNRTAWLTAADGRNRIFGTTFSTTDSEWMVNIPGAHDNGPYPWLTYLGTNGIIYKSRIVCRGIASGNTPRIETSFSQRRKGSQNEHEQEWIGIVDWDGTPWRVEVQDVNHDYGKPEFKLSR